MIDFIVIKVNICSWTEKFLGIAKYDKLPETLFDENRTNSNRQHTRQRNGGRFDDRNLLVG